MIAHAILREGGMVRMPRPKHVFEGRVVLGSGVGVAHQHRDRGAQRDALEHSRKNLDLVGFAPLRGERALARAPPIHLALQLGRVHRDPGRHAVDHHAHRRAMRLAEGGDDEQSAERGRHG